MSALRSAFAAARAVTRRNVSTSAVVRSDAIMMVRNLRSQLSESASI